MQEYRQLLIKGSAPIPNRQEAIFAFVKPIYEILKTTNLRVLKTYQEYIWVNLHADHEELTMITLTYDVRGFYDADSLSTPRVYTEYDLFGAVITRSKYR